MEQKKEYLKHLKIATNYSPSHTINNALKLGGNHTIYVEDGRLISLLSEAFGFQYEIFVPKDGQYGTPLPDGNWTGLIGMVQREEVNLSIAYIAHNYQRSLVVPFSYPYSFSKISFISDNLEYSHDSYSISRPFSSSVWIAVAISMLSIMVISPLFKANRDATQKVLLYLYRGLLGHSIDIDCRKVSAKLFVISWIIGCAVIAQAYIAVLLSFLSLPNLTGIRNIPELSKAAEDSSFKCSTYAGGFLKELFLNAEDEPLKKIQECLKRSDMFVNEPAEVLKYRPYRIAFIGIEHQCKEYENFYRLSEDYFSIGFSSIAVSKSFCCKQELDKVLHQIDAAGLYQKFISDDLYMKSLHVSNHFLSLQENNEEESAQKALSIQNLFGAFFCLIVGHTLAISVLGIEICLAKYTRNAKTYQAK